MAVAVDQNFFRTGAQGQVELAGVFLEQQAGLGDGKRLPLEVIAQQRGARPP